MLIERIIERTIHKIDKPMRGALLVALISASGGGIPSSVGGGINKFVRGAEAAGLELDEKPLVLEEQEDPNMAAARKLVEAVAKKDLVAFRELIGGDYSAWIQNPPGLGQRSLSQDQMVQLFSRALSRGKPNCVGIIQTAPTGSSGNRKYTGVVFEGLDTYSNDLSRGTVFGFWVDAASLRWTIHFAEELTREQLAQIKKEGPKPCPSVAAAPVVSKPEVKPAPKPELPKDLPKGKIVYVANKDGNSDIYSSNPDGSGQERLTTAKEWDGKPRFLPDGSKVVFKNDQGVFLLDMKTKQVKLLVPGKVEAPAPLSKDTVIFSKVAQATEGVVQDDHLYDFWTIKTDASSLSKITKPDTPTGVEPDISPDGKFLAYGVSYFEGTVVRIVSRDALNDRDAGVMLEGRSMNPRWSPDGQRLLFSKFISSRAQEGRWDLYTVKPDGSGAQVLVENAWQGSWSPDGKWVIFSRKAQGETDYDLFIVSASGGTPIKLFDTPYDEDEPQWQPLIVPSRKQIALVPGMLTFIENGIERNGRFTPLRERLVEEGFSYPDSFVSSYMGGYFDEQGNFHTNDQTCEDTLQGIERAAKNQSQTVLGWLERHPNDELIIVAHSLGGPVMLRAFELIRAQNPNIDLSRVKLITTNSPNQGVDKRPLELLNTILPPGLPSDCYITAPIIGPTPPPQVFDYPTLRSLLEMWDQRGETQRRWQRLTTWMKSRGAQIFALGNYHDCVIALEMCASKVVGRWPWDIILPPYLSWIDDPWFWATLPSVLWTQEIPGATNILRALGNAVDWGHTPYLNEGKGMEILVTLVGEQKKPRRRRLKIAV